MFGLTATAVDTIRAEAQAGVGLLLLSLPNLVSEIKYPVACLSAIYFCLTRLLIQKDTTLGSHLRMATMQLAAMMFGSVMGACLVALSKGVSSGNSHVHTGLVVFLALGGLLPITLARASSTDMVLSSGLMASTVYGTTITYTNVSENAVEVWLLVSRWLILDVALSAAAIVVVGTLVMPTTAAGQVMDGATKLVGDTADALEMCMQLLCVPPEIENISIAPTEDTSAALQDLRTGATANATRGVVPTFTERGAHHLHRRWLSELSSAVLADEMTKALREPLPADLLPPPPVSNAAVPANVQHPIRVALEGRDLDSSSDDSPEAFRDVEAPPLEVLPPASWNAQQYFQNIEKTTAPPPKTLLPRFQLFPEPVGTHLLPAGKAWELRRDKDAIQKMFVPLSFEPPWAHSLMALWARWSLKGWGMGWRKQTESKPKTSQAAGGGGGQGVTAAVESAPTSPPLHPTTTTTGASASGGDTAPATFTTNAWKDVLTAMGNVLDTLAALEAVIRDQSKSDSDHEYDVQDVTLGHNTPQPLILTQSHPDLHPQTTSSSPSLLGMGGTHKTHAIKRRLHSHKEAIAFVGHAGDVGGVGVAKGGGLGPAADQLLSGARRLWFIPEGANTVGQAPEHSRHVETYLHAHVRAALRDAVLQMRVVHAAIQRWPLPEARRCIESLLVVDGTVPIHIYDIPNWCPMGPVMNMDTHSKAISKALPQRSRAYWAHTVKQALEASGDKPLRIAVTLEVRAQHFVALATHQAVSQVEALTKRVATAFQSAPPPAAPAAPPAPATPRPPAPYSPSDPPHPAPSPPLQVAPWLLEVYKVLTYETIREYIGSCWNDLIGAVKDKDKRKALMGNKRAHYGFKYWMVLSILLIIILVIQHIQPDSLAVARPNFMYATAASVMRPQVETTVAYGVLRVTGTVAGCMLGYGVMSSVATLSEPVLVSGSALVSGAALVGFLVIISIMMLYSTSRTQLRIVTYVTATSLIATTWCQGCCDVTGTLSYALYRMGSISIGAIFPMLVNHMVLPWYLNLWALGRLSDSYQVAAKLLKEQYDTMVKHLGGPPATEGAANTHNHHHAPTASAATTTTATTSDQPPFAATPTVLSTPSQSSNALVVPGAVAITWPVLGNVDEDVVPPSTQPAASVAAAATQQLAGIGQVAIQIATSSTHMATPVPKHAAAKQSDAHAAIATSNAAQTDTKALAAAAAAAKKGTGASVPAAKPPTLASMQAPLTEVIAALARDATPWQRGMWATPHAVHALLAAITMLADRHAALQHRKSQECVVQLSDLVSKLMSTEPHTPQRSMVIGDLQDELAHALAVRWHARSYHVLLIRAMHMRVLKAVRRQIAFQRRKRPAFTQPPLTEHPDVWDSHLTIPSRALGDSSQRHSKSTPDLSEIEMIAARRRAVAKARLDAAGSSAAVASQPRMHSVRSVEGLLSTLEDSDQAYPSDAAAWQGFTYALTHVMDAAVLVARTALEVVGCTDATRQNSLTGEENQARGTSPRGVSMEATRA